MERRSLRHNAHSSKILLKLFIVALMIIQTIVVTVGRSYYNRFIELEKEDTQFDKEIEALQYELKLCNQRIVDLESEMKMINTHLIEGANDK